MDDIGWNMKDEEEDEEETYEDDEDEQSPPAPVNPHGGGSVELRSAPWAQRADGL